MTNHDVYIKALEKAAKNGWNGSDYHANFSAYIFSHDFAKAFWGEGTIHYGGKPENAVFHTCAWQYHLGKMVLEENPLQYLAKFL